MYPLCLQIEDSHFNGQSAICSLLFKNKASRDQDEKTLMPLRQRNFDSVSALNYE